MRKWIRRNPAALDVAFAAGLVFCAGLYLVGYALQAYAAGTVTTTEKGVGTVKKVVFAWTSSSGGAADATTTVSYDGRLIGLTTIPAAAGSAPTDNYDLVVKDADGYDVLLGAGIDRDTANTEYRAESTLGAVAASKLTLAITNAGDTKSGTVVIFLR